MAQTIGVARLGVVLKFADGKEVILNEGSCVTGLRYMYNKKEYTLDGCVRVICARTTAYSNGPTTCPPEPYMQDYITPTQLVIDSSTEHHATLTKVNIADILDIEDAYDEHDTGEIPTTSVGGEDAKYKTLQDAIDAMERGDIDGELVLEEDVVENLVVRGTVMLDLNGHTITAPEAAPGDKYHHTIMVDGGTLIIDGEGEILNGTRRSYCVFNAGAGATEVTPDQKVTSLGDGCVIINGGTFRHTGEDKDHTSYCVVNHGSEMVINGGSFSTAYDYASLVCNGYQFEPLSTPIMTINGGEFAGGRHTINNDHSGHMRVTGGTFTMGTPWEGMDGKQGPKNVLRNENNARVIIEGGDFTGAIENSNTAEGSMQITGGTFTANVEAYLVKGYKQVSGKVSK